MGGSSGSVSTTRTTPTRRKPSPSKTRLNALVKALKGLSATKQKRAIAELKDAGLGDVAKALEAFLGTGSRPAERRRGD
jgi:hypothetical protein